MQINRRRFIQFAVGTVAGIHLTPLPWKLIDDISIWTQNWQWVPRLAKSAHITGAQTVCDLCPGGCGITVRLADKNRAIKVEGTPAAPVNQGKVCPMGAAGPQYQYSLARFQSPLRRIGARGSGAFAKISWDEAFKEVGGRLAELREKGESHTVAMITGRRNTLARMMAERFMRAYGSPNVIEMPSLGLSCDYAERAQFGRAGATGYDLENSKFILSFGCGLIEGWGAPVRSIQIFSASRRERPARIVQIDSRASLTASKADQWVAIAPGTEAALALGLAHVIVKGGLYDARFVAEHTFGFEEFKSMVLADYEPGQVEEITGVPAAEIIKLAKAFAQSESAVAVAGKGRGDIPTPVYELMAVQALNALVGNINQPGGVIVRKDLPLTPWPELSPDQTASRGMSAPRLDLAGGDQYPLSGSLLANLTESVHKGRLYPVNALIIDQANPAYLGSDPAGFRAAMDRIPFIVSVSGLADDTSVYADIVLPACSNFEGPVEVMTPPTAPYPLFGMAGAVLPKPFFDTKPIGDIYIGLSKAVGEGAQGAIPFKSYKDAIQYSAAGLFQSGRGKTAASSGEAPGLEFGSYSESQIFDDEKAFMEALSTGHFWYDPAFSFGNLDEVFHTPSGRFEFVSQTLKAALARYVGLGNDKALAELGLTKPDQAYLPHFEPYMPARHTGEGAVLTLMPVEQFKLVNSAKGNAPYLTKLLDDITLMQTDLVVEINPRTASALGLHEGDRAWLTTKKGKLTVRVHLFDGARPDVVYAPIGLGHSAYDLYLRGKGVNPMEIVDGVADPLSGQALWWGTRANLTKV